MNVSHLFDMAHIHHWACHNLWQYSEQTANISYGKLNDERVKQILYNWHNVKHTTCYYLFNTD